MVVSVEEELAYLHKEYCNSDGSPDFQAYLLIRAANAYLAAEKAAPDSLRRFGDLRRRFHIPRNVFFSAVACGTDIEPNFIFKSFEGFIYEAQNASTKGELCRAYERSFRFSKLFEMLDTNSNTPKAVRKRLKKLSYELVRAGGMLENRLTYGFPKKRKWRFEVVPIEDAVSSLEAKTTECPVLKDVIDRLVTSGTAHSADWVIYLRNRHGESPWFAPVQEKPAYIFPEESKLDVDVPRVNLNWFEGQFCRDEEFRMAYLEDLTNFLRSSSYSETTGHDRLVLLSFHDEFSPKLAECCQWTLFRKPGNPARRFRSLAGVHISNPGCDFTLGSVRLDCSLKENPAAYHPRFT